MADILLKNTKINPSGSKQQGIIGQDIPRLELLEEENFRLKQQILELSEINSRLGDLLNEYAVKYGSLQAFTRPSKLIQGAGNANISQPLPPQIIKEFPYYADLLNAYDQKMYTLDLELVKANQSMEKLKAQVALVIRDNESLGEELKNKSLQLTSLYKDGSSNFTVKNIYNNVEKDELQELILNLEEERNILAENYNDAMLKLTSKIKDLETKTNSFNEIQHKYRELSREQNKIHQERDEKSREAKALRKHIEVLQYEFTSIENMKNDNEVQLVKTSNKLKGQDEKYQIVKEEQEKLQKIYTEEIEQKNKEINKMKIDIKKYQNDVILKDETIDYLQIQVEKLKRDLKTEQDKFQQSISMIETYETRIDSIEKDKIEINQMKEDCRQKVNKAILDGQKAIQEKLNLEKVLSNIRNQQKEEILELKKSGNDLLNQTQHRLQEIINEKNEEISQLNGKYTEVRARLERLERINLDLKTQINKYELTMQDTYTISDQQIDNLHRKINELEEQLAAKDDEYNQKIEKLENEKNDINNENTKLKVNFSDNKQYKEQYKVRVVQLENENVLLRSKLENISREREAEAAAINDIKLKYQKQLELNTQEYTRQLRNYQTKISKNQLNELIEKNQIQDTFQSKQIEEQNIRKALDRKIQLYEETILDLKNENKILTQKYKEVKSQLLQNQ